MKKTKIIIPALGLLLLSTAASVTGTVAWFSANAKVAVTGMQVKTKVSSNLLIAADTLDSTAKKADSNFGSSLNQSVKGYLEPVSSVNGTSFFYTLNAKANGAKESGDYLEYNAATAASDTTTYANKFSEDYGVSKATVETFVGSEGPASAYVDYVFQVKAVATEASYINMKKLFLVDGNPKDQSVAHRVAVFTEDITAGTATAAPGTKQVIYTVSGADNQTSGKAVNSTTTVDTVSYNTYANTTLATISEAGTKYYKVVVRMWLEGEDTTCYNDMFLALTNSWSLDLDLALETSTASIANNISKLWTGKVSTTDYWYDGTSVYTSLEDAKAGTNGTAKASAAEAVKTLFGIA